MLLSVRFCAPIGRWTKSPETRVLKTSFLNEWIDAKPPAIQKADEIRKPLLSIMYLNTNWYQYSLPQGRRVYFFCKVRLLKQLHMQSLQMSLQKRGGALRKLLIACSSKNVFSVWQTTTLWTMWVGVGGSAGWYRDRIRDYLDSVVIASTPEAFTWYWTYNRNILIENSINCSQQEIMSTFVAIYLLHLAINTNMHHFTIDTLMHNIF